MVSLIFSIYMIELQKQNGVEFLLVKCMKTHLLQALSPLRETSSTSVVS